MFCIPLPLSSWKSFWNSCLWDSALGLKTGVARSSSGLRAWKSREDHAGVTDRYWYRASEWQCLSVSAAASVPVTCGYQRTEVTIYNLSFPLEISLLCFPLSSVKFFLHFKFREICHQLLECLAGFKTKFSPVQKHTVPFTPTCLAMFLSFAHVLLNENVTLPFLANLWN